MKRKKDVALEEIRAVRHKISKQFGHDTRALLDHYRELEEKYRDRLLPPTPFRPVVEKEEKDKRARKKAAG